jgi:hypothetical protein
MTPAAAVGGFRELGRQASGTPSGGRAAHQARRASPEDPAAPLARLVVSAPAKRPVGDQLRQAARSAPLGSRRLCEPTPAGLGPGAQEALRRHRPRL